jgi:hypothetical protein
VINYSTLEKHSKDQGLAVQDPVVEFVAQHDHVLKMFLGTLLAGISVVPDLGLSEEVEATSVDDTGAGMKWSWFSGQKKGLS